MPSLSRARELRRKLRENITAATLLAGREEVTAVTDIKRSAGINKQRCPGHAQTVPLPRILLVHHGMTPFAHACDWRCPAGPRAYLLGDMEDFWALGDLVDLSRGAASPLSKWLVKAEAETAALSK